MNTNQLNYYGKNNVVTKKDFLGTYACDILPGKINKRQFGLIINACPSAIYSNSCHWIAVYKKNGVISVMDSLAGDLEKTNIFINEFLRGQKARKIIKNTTKIQSDKSQQCGLFSLCYLYARSAQVSHKKFISIFSKTNLDLNDLIIKKMFKKMYKN